MKKNILIGLLTIMTLLSFMYAYVQQGVAKANEERAFEQAKIAQEQTIIAQHQALQLQLCQQGK